MQKILRVKKLYNEPAVTRIRTWVASATTKSTNHYTITATIASETIDQNLKFVQTNSKSFSQDNKLF